MDTRPVAEGLRARKTRRTRERIAQAALDLFARQGYRRTTIAQIAEAAEVSPRTVSGHFPAKEELIFHLQEEWFADLERRLAERDVREPTLEVVRAWIEARMPEWYELAQERRLRRRIVASDEALLAHAARFLDRAHDVLAAAIARDLGREPDHIEPQMAAAATVAVFKALEIGDEAEPGVGLGAWRERVRRLVDQAVRFVGAGIESLR